LVCRESDGTLPLKLFSEREHEMIIKAAAELKALREKEETGEEGAAKKPAAPVAAPKEAAPGPSGGSLVPYGDDQV
jgi:hypothetical protein